MNCVSCRREIADGSNFCPYCGTTQPSAGAAPAGSPATPAPGPGLPSSAPPSIGSGTYSQGGVPSGAPMPGASGRATLAMVLGISSLVIDVFGALACCWCYGLGGLVGLGLGLAAFITGRNELEDIAAGFSSPAGEGTAKAGKTMGIIGMILGFLAFCIGIAVIAFAILSESGSTY